MILCELRTVPGTSVHCGAARSTAPQVPNCYLIAFFTTSPALGYREGWFYRPDRFVFSKRGGRREVGRGAMQGGSDDSSPAPARLALRAKLKASLLGLNVRMIA